MAQEICLAGKVDNIAALLAEYRVPAALPVLMLLEMQPQHVIEPHQRQDLLYFAQFERTFDCSSYTSGRIFHQDGELRWEKQAGAFQVVYTGRVQYSPELEVTASLVLDSYLPTFKNYFLFGKRLDSTQLQRIGAPAQAGDFAEVRIPRLLRYPAPQGSERVQLVVKEYCDPDTGAGVAFRFTQLVGAE
ncbi:MAG: CRISPR-associated protein Csx19 [Ktedonobacteraceae bacterium]